MLEYKVTLNDDDFLLFNQYHFLNSPSGKKSLLSYRLILPIISLLMVVILFIEESEFQIVLIEAIVMAILSILWIGYSKKMIFKGMKKQIQKLKKEGKLPYSSEAILKFGDESMHEITPNTEIMTKYSMIEKIAVTEKAIYIFFSAVQAYIIPVTAFSEEGEKLKFLEFIHLKLRRD